MSNKGGKLSREERERLTRKFLSGLTVEDVYGYATEVSESEKEPKDNNQEQHQESADFKLFKEWCMAKYNRVPNQDDYEAAKEWILELYFLSINNK